jgi:hypothetical protein
MSTMIPTPRSKATPVLENALLNATRYNTMTKHCHRNENRSTLFATHFGIRRFLPRGLITCQQRLYHGRGGSPVGPPISGASSKSLAANEFGWLGSAIVDAKQRKRERKLYAAFSSTDFSLNTPTKQGQRRLQLRQVPLHSSNSLGNFVPIDAKPLAHLNVSVIANLDTGL